jgi:Ca2+-binding RTX toxin-like protein
VGGGGGDRVSYFGAYESPDVGVTVTQDDVANDGAPGEGDNIHSDISDIQGTQHGDDVIIGSAVDNFISGVAGDDRLEGGAGDDIIYPGDGRNVVVGGAGADEIRGDGGETGTFDARDGERDIVSCLGSSVLVSADAIDQLINCPNASIG